MTKFGKLDQKAALFDNANDAVYQWATNAKVKLSQVPLMKKLAERTNELEDIMKQTLSQTW